MNLVEGGDNRGSESGHRVTVLEKNFNSAMPEPSLPLAHQFLQRALFLLGGRLPAPSHLGFLTLGSACSARAFRWPHGARRLPRPPCPPPPQLLPPRSAALAFGLRGLGVPPASAGLGTASSILRASSPWRSRGGSLGLLLGFGLPDPGVHHPRVFGSRQFGFPSARPDGAPVGGFPRDLALGASLVLALRAAFSGH